MAYVLSVAEGCDLDEGEETVEVAGSLEGKSRRKDPPLALPRGDLQVLEELPSFPLRHGIVQLADRLQHPLGELALVRRG